jgi:dolichol-phosphate mannosyltransferase
MKSRVSVIVTVFNEGEKITPFLISLLESTNLSREVLVVYDFPEDTTAPYARAVAEKDQRVKPLLNTYGRGPAWAIRYGMDHASGDVVVVTMGDGCDDVTQIDELARMVEGGAAIGAASRYMRGGRKVGGPFIKGSLSRIAGVSLYYLARVGTRDATNSFKAYDTAFIREAGIASTDGFEIGIELVAKAKRMRRPVIEMPTTWREREYGVSHFKLRKWVPKYLRWYLYALGPRTRENHGAGTIVSDVGSATIEDA